MAQHRLLSAAAAKLGATASVPTLALATSAPAAPLAAVAPTPASDDQIVDVVTVAEANAAIAEAETRGAAAERARTTAVLGSDAGKAHRDMAAFMLDANPTASSEAIVAALGRLPAAAAPAAAAPAAPAAAPIAAPAPAAPAAAITTPLTDTPIVAVVTDAHNGGEAGVTQAEIDKSWDAAASSAAASATNNFGPEIAPGLKRTGN